MREQGSFLQVKNKCSIRVDQREPSSGLLGCQKACPTSMISPFGKMMMDTEYPTSYPVRMQYDNYGKSAQVVTSMPHLAATLLSINYKEMSV